MFRDAAETLQTHKQEGDGLVFKHLYEDSLHSEKINWEPLS